jgi:exopolyphosphatase/guanosine-5'-triphosphate,3'-diphosphate pyrophosphatase
MPGEFSAAEQLESAMRLLKTCPEHEAHARQVARLSISLFDELARLHGMGDAERFLMECAALLHDIGWVSGQSRHHKTSLHIILDSPLLLFDEQQRLLIGSVARYHRRALPRRKHRHYAELPAEKRMVVRVLSGILRVADALDVRHENAVERIRCSVSAGRIVISCRCGTGLEQERTAAARKGKLLEQVFARRISLTSPSESVRIRGASGRRAGKKSP